MEKGGSQMEPPFPVPGRRMGIQEHRASNRTHGDRRRGPLGRRRGAGDRRRADL